MTDIKDDGIVIRFKSESEYEILYSIPNFPEILIEKYRC